MEQSSAKALPKPGESTFPELITKSQRVVWNPNTLALPVVWPSFTRTYSEHLVTEGSGHRPPGSEPCNRLNTPRSQSLLLRAIFTFGSRSERNYAILHWNTALE